VTGLSGSLRLSFSLSQRHAMAKLRHPRTKPRRDPRLDFTRFRSSYAPKVVTLTGCNRRASEQSKARHLHETPRFVNSPRRQTRAFVFSKSHRDKSIDRIIYVYNNVTNPLSFPFISLNAYYIAIKKRVLTILVWSVCKNYLKKYCGDVK